MVERASVQPEAASLITPSSVDGPLQKPFAQSAADELACEAELNQFDFAGLAAVELREAGGDAVDVQHLQFIERMLDDGGEVRVREFAAAEPMKRAADGVVQIAIRGDGRSREKRVSRTASTRRTWKRPRCTACANRPWKRRGHSGWN